MLKLHLRPHWSLPASILVAATFVSLIVASTAQAATLTVCSAGCEYSTIQAAVAAASSGDTITVGAGTYSEVVTVNKNIALLGAQVGLAGNSHSGGESTVTAINVTNANVTVDGFKIDPGTSNSGVALSFQGGSAETVQNNVITGYGYDAATSHGTEGVSLAGTSGMLFQHNLLVSPTATGQTQYSDPAAQDGIFAASGVSNNTQILNNVFQQASTYPGTDIGLSYTSGTNPTISDNVSTDGATFVTLFDSTGAQITGNSFATDSSLSGSAIYIGGGNTTTTVSGNTVSGSYFGVALRSVDGLNVATTITGNALTGNYGGGISVGNGAIGSSEIVVAHQNDLSSNPVGINNLSAGSVNATQNWWGSAVATTIPSEISGSGVAYAPYYLSSTGALDGTGTLDNDASLTSLSLSSGSLSPAFSSSVTSYTASVDNSVTSVTVNKTAVSGATAVVSGGSNLDVGNNTATVTVTAADGTTTKTYTVVIDRAAPAPAAAPTTTATTTTTPAPATAPVVNQPSPPTAATPTQSGSVSISVGAATTTPAPGEVKIATLTEPVAPVTVGASWPIGTFTTPVMVQMTPTPQLASTPIAGETSPAGNSTPSPIAGGFSVGNTVFQLTVTNSSTGAAVTSFQAPIVFHVSALAVGEVPAYSHDGTTWTTIPQLDSPELPATQPDGYYVNADGSADIYTRHATYFGLLVDTQAPSTPKLKIQIDKTGLRLSLSGARDNIGVAGYVISRNGRGYKTTVHTSVMLALKAGNYVVRARDTSGNVSQASNRVTIARTPGKSLRFALKS